MTRPDPRKLEVASKLLAQANGRINLMLARRKLSRSGMREAAEWAFRGARMLRDEAGLDAEVAG